MMGRVLTPTKQEITVTSLLQLDRYRRLRKKMMMCSILNFTIVQSQKPFKLHFTFVPHQSQIVSDPLKLNKALDGLVLGGLRVFGVPSAPHCVLANRVKVRNFTYRSDTKVSSKYSTWKLSLSEGNSLF